MAESRPNQIGPYTILRELGRGGMGVVFLGRDSRLDRHVAIKALPDEVGADPARLARFEQEARALAALNHPNVAAIYGVEEQDGRRYLILEYVDGETLADRIDRGPLPPEEAVEFAAQIARGIEAAHDSGVIHRDLKPDNIKITPGGVIKVLDFGLAKAGGAGSSSSSAMTTAPTSPRAPTLPGAILGTAAYMSPEQARGRTVDKRTDVWSFGVVLFEMLTGVSPFAGESASDSIGAVLHKEVDLTRLPKETPTGARRVLQRCLSRDRSLRYRDIGDARLDLESSPDAESARSPEASSPWRHLGWVVAVLTIGALGWSLATMKAPVRSTVRSAVLAPESEQVEALRISPDGRRIAIITSPVEVGTTEGTRAKTLYLRDLGSGEMTRVPGSEGVESHRFSPDGTALAFMTRGEESSDPERLMRAPSDLSRPPVEIMRVPPQMRAGGSDAWFSWTPRGELAFINKTSREIILYDAGAGRELRRLPLKFDGDLDQLGGLDAPFGDRFITAFVESFTPEGYSLGTAIIDVDAGIVTPALADGAMLRELGNGDVVFARGDSILRSAFDKDRLTLTGELRLVESGLATRSHWAHGEFDLSRTNTLIYLPGGVQGLARQLVMIARDGETTPWFDERRAFEEYIAISPDGNRLAVVIAGPRGLYELWVSNTDQPRLRRLYAEPGGDTYKPVFTPDGEHVVLSFRNPSREDVSRMLVLPFDGSEPPRRIWSPWPIGDWAIPCSVSPDGERALITAYSAGTTRVIEAPLDREAEGLELMASDDIFTLSYAPTEAPLIQYISTETGRAEVFVRTLNDGVLGPAIPVTTRGAWSSYWMVDEDKGLCVAHFDLGWREWITPIRWENGRIGVGDPVLTGRLGDAQYDDRAITRDGRYIAIRRGDDEGPPLHLTLVQDWLAGAGAR